jgi:ornithine carbamoyltransferase
MGHKESIADTARVLARFYDGIEFRGFKQETVETLAEYSSVPVWNGLTDACHPTQALADFMTMEEHLGSLKGKTLAFVGDTHNNVSNSLMAMSAKMGVNYIALGPAELAPGDEIVAACQPIAERNGSTITIASDPAVLKGVADAIYTDVWLSLGEDKAKWGERIKQLGPYRVTKAMMDSAKPGAIFLHCLPSFHNLDTSVGRDINAEFGLTEMEVSDEVFESERSVVFDEAENRMHTIKAVMYLTLVDT